MTERRLNPAQARKSKHILFHCPNSVNGIQDKWVGTLFFCGGGERDH